MLDGNLQSASGDAFIYHEFLVHGEQTEPMRRICPQSPRTSPHDGNAGQSLAEELQYLQKWAKREEITCFRVYDRDIPEEPVTVDWYEGRALVQCAEHFLSGLAGGLFGGSRMLARLRPGIPERMRITRFRVGYPALKRVIPGKAGIPWDELLPGAGTGWPLPDSR